MLVNALEMTLTLNDSTPSFSKFFVATTLTMTASLNAIVKKLSVLPESSELLINTKQPFVAYDTTKVPSTVEMLLALNSPNLYPLNRTRPFSVKTNEKLYATKHTKGAV